MASKIEHFTEEIGKEKLNDMKAKCIKADYIYSKVTDANDVEVTVPAIVLDKPLGEKEKYLDIEITSAWQFIMVSFHESYLFLNFRFDGKDEISFKFDMAKAENIKWITRLIETNGIIIVCDKSRDFDIGITNIPTDIPQMQLTYLKIAAARKSKCIGG